MNNMEFTQVMIFAAVMMGVPALLGFGLGYVAGQAESLRAMFKGFLHEFISEKAAQQLLEQMDETDREAT